VTAESTTGLPVVSVEVPSTLEGERLDRSVALLAGTTRAVAARMVDTGAVQLDGVVVANRRRQLRPGQRLRIELPELEATGPLPDPSVVFEVVYEDRHVIVVDKPAGLVVHHGSGHRGGTLVDGLVARYPELLDLAEAGAGDADRPGIVHRLDKDTSGLVIVARTADAYRWLSAQMRTHEAGRIYTALVHGVPKDNSGIVDAPVGRSIRTPTRMAVAVTGRPAQTRYQVVEAFARPVPAALLDVSLQTGRTHQIRVHMAAIGHPVVGDSRYGRPTDVAADRTNLGAPRQFLHARELTVTLVDGVVTTWQSPLPDDLVAVLRHFA